MDKLYSFTAKNTVGNLKSVIQQEQKLQFYSEEEFDSSNDTPKNSQMTKKSKFNQRLDFAEDQDNTPKGSNQTGFCNDTQKMSKFRTLVNTKQIEGDLENEPQFSDGETKVIISAPKNENNDDDYNIKEQEEKVKQRLPKENDKKQKKHNQSNQQLSVNSDNEKIKKKAVHGDTAFRDHPFKHLIFGTAVSEVTFKKYLLLTQRGLIYARKCLKGPSDKFIKSKQLVLGEAKVKKDKTLVLDLDETLIHSCQPRDNPQVYVTAYGESGEEAKIGVNIRPYTSHFLQRMSQYFTIYIYTASSQAYANAILGYIDPQKEFICGMLTRSNCMETKNGFFIKDLRIISNKKLKDMIIVDNLAHSFGFQIENGVPILEWYNDQNDMELKMLGDYLIEASKVDDVREFNKQKLKLGNLIEYNIEG